MTPVDYHKSIRLHEARRQLTARTGSVSSFAAGVGYRSASQLSRDYRRAFGRPPSRERTGVGDGSAASLR